MSPSGSTMMSPRLMPIRRSRSEAPFAFVASWTSTAHLTASTGLPNSHRNPSPVVFTSRPPRSLTLGSMTSRWSALTRRSVPSSSFSIMEEKPTTSAARIAARRRVVIRGDRRGGALLHSGRCLAPVEEGLAPGGWKYAAAHPPRATSSSPAVLHQIYPRGHGSWRLPEAPDETEAALAVSLPHRLRPRQLGLQRIARTRWLPVYPASSRLSGSTEPHEQGAPKQVQNRPAKF